MNLKWRRLSIHLRWLWWRINHIYLLTCLHLPLEYSLSRHISLNYSSRVYVGLVFVLSLLASFWLQKPWDGTLKLGALSRKSLLIELLHKRILGDSIHYRPLAFLLVKKATQCSDCQLQICKFHRAPALYNFSLVRSGHMEISQPLLIWFC